MLAADHRLRDSETFRRVVRSGRRAADDALVVHLRAGEAGSGPARAGLVVSRAVGDAVTRNRVKRRLRHLLRAPLDALPAGSEVVVRALPRARELSSSELGASLTRSLSRAAGRTGARPGPGGVRTDEGRSMKAAR